MGSWGVLLEMNSRDMGVNEFRWGGVMRLINEVGSCDMAVLMGVSGAGWVR